MPSLLVNEVFHSIQGESTWAGCRCVFIRLTGCPLRCRYCDTAYAFTEGTRREIDDLVHQTVQLAKGCKLVEVTGGEPLIQQEVHALMSKLCDLGLTVLLETSGACDISPCDRRVIRIMDLKTPDSGECERNLPSNITHLREQDEVKFVVGSRRDYDWSCDMIHDHHLDRRAKAILFSAANPADNSPTMSEYVGLPHHKLAEWMLADTLPANVRLQIQLHKVIWDPSQRGV